MPKVKYTNKDGIIVPSTTTVIGKMLGWNKEILIAWTRMNALKGIDPKKLSKMACDTGTLVHKYIEVYNNKEETNDDLQQLKTKATFNQVVVAERGLEQYKKIEKEYNIIPIISELKSVNEEYQFGLTPDMIGTVNKIKCLLDYKTSKELYSDHVIQISAYYKSLEKEHELKNAYFVHIKKEFDEENTEEKIVSLIPIPMNLIDEGWEIFKTLLFLYKKQPIIEQYIKSINE